VVRDRYLVKSVVHSALVLAAFTGDEALPLAVVASRSQLPKPMAFRLLYTLKRCGLIEQVAKNLYRRRDRPSRRRML
jgi:DNA-binding IclR family transcriptional regulator